MKTWDDGKSNSDKPSDHTGDCVYAKQENSSPTRVANAQTVGRRSHGMMSFADLECNLLLSMSN